MKYLWYVIAALIAAIAACVGHGMNERKRAAEQKEREKRAEDARKKQEERIKAEKLREQQKAEQEKKEKLADQYCDVLQEIENLKAEEIYTNTFLRYSRVYKVLLGLERRCVQEGMKDRDFLDEITVELKNSAIDRQLSPEGFRLQVNPEIVDRKMWWDKCMAKSTGVLFNELEKQRKELVHYQSHLNCKDYILRTEKELYALIQSADSGNVAKCRSLILKIQRVLEECGCVVVFADSEYVLNSEDMRVDFSDDSQDATELPCLYSRKKDGTLAQIGMCGGTKRRSRQ